MQNGSFFQTISMEEEHNLMKIYFFNLLIVTTILIIAQAALSESDIQIGYEVTLAVPTVYAEGFLGRAFLIETAQTAPHFTAAISVEAVEDKYACSLDVLLGNVRVWSSGHLSRFYTDEKCVLELTQYGELRLTGQSQRVGWRSGTEGQGVKRLNLLRTGNLVLVDALNSIKWQSFNFPTDIMLWGQRLSSQTRLTSFPVNSTFFYSMEIQHDKIALFLNFNKSKYSYWEYHPSTNLNITFVQLTSTGLEIFNGSRRFDQIKSTAREPLRFLSLQNSTGNLILYHYSQERQKFEASYQALGFTCDLPLACKPYGICTSSGSCSCIRLDGLRPDCGEAEMLELEGVVSVLKSVGYSVGSKQECAELCLDDCGCVAAQYDAELGECFMYNMARGIKQVERGGRVRYMVKVARGTNHGQVRGSGLKKWVLIVVIVVDAFVIFLVLGGVGYYLIWRRRKNLLGIRGQAS